MYSAVHVVDLVSRPIVDAHFHYALTNTSAVAGIPHFHSTNAASDVRDGVGIPKTPQSDALRS